MSSEEGSQGDEKQQFPGGFSSLYEAQKCSC